MTSRVRADRLLVDRGLFESRARAQAAIRAGLVRADGLPVRKASDELPADAALEARAEHPWVSRGGVKLAAALDAFAFDPVGLVCLDVGASTGGFTDVLLARGARHVYVVDVGSGQLHPRLRGRPELTMLEKTDIRGLDAARIAEAPGLIVVDVSFIPLKLVLPPITKLAAHPARLIALVKPQFESGRRHVKKGIVRDATVHQRVCAEAGSLVQLLGWRILGCVPSPILGGDGNREFLLGAARD